MITVNRQSMLIMLCLIISLFISQNQAIKYSINVAKTAQVAGYDERVVAGSDAILSDQIPLVRLMAESGLSTQGGDDLSALFYKPKAATTPKIEKAPPEELPVDDGKAAVTNYESVVKNHIRIVGFMSGGVILNNVFYTIGQKMTISIQGDNAALQPYQLTATIKDIRARQVILNVDGVDYTLKMR